MWTDEIVKKIHLLSEEYSRSFNHNLKAIFVDLQKQQAESGREVVNLSLKTSLTIRWSGRARNLGKKSKETIRRSTWPFNQKGR